MKKITLLAKDFKGTKYLSWDNNNGRRPSCGCAIERASFRSGLGKNIQEFALYLEIDGVAYAHDDYDHGSFNKDQEKAEAVGFDDTVIREIELREGF